MSYFKNEMEPKLRPFLDLIKEENLHEIQIEHDDFLLVARKEQRSGRLAPSATKRDEAEETLIPVTSNLVGTVHLSDPKSGKPLLYEGQDVMVGQLLCLINAMNLKNEVRSPYDGVVKKIMISEGDMVEYGRPLLMLAVKDGKEANGV
ncbi:MAG: hypothetical protein M1269_06320 [Chloroflexi bacterium]|nr:hypothetical protein [Chloroflexota bacterium]